MALGVSTGRLHHSTWELVLDEVEVTERRETVHSHVHNIQGMERERGREGDRTAHPDSAWAWTPMQPVTSIPVSPNPSIPFAPTPPTCTGQHIHARIALLGRTNPQAARLAARTPCVTTNKRGSGLPWNQDLGCGEIQRGAASSLDGRGPERSTIEAGEVWSFLAFFLIDAIINCA